MGVWSGKPQLKLDLAFNNVKPKDWYFILDKVHFMTELGEFKTNKSKFLAGWIKGIILGC